MSKENKPKTPQVQTVEDLITEVFKQVDHDNPQHPTAYLPEEFQIGNMTEENSVLSIGSLVAAWWPNGEDGPEAMYIPLVAADGTPRFLHADINFMVSLAQNILQTAYALDGQNPLERIAELMGIPLHPLDINPDKPEIEC